ncbi:MAG: DNA primase [Bacteroidales bacterium]|nr:DNA primase [Bacteroidales bacterium]
MIPADTVNLILETARVEDIVGDYLTLKRRGASYVACCPFHNEKTPSFYVTPSKGIFKCFGCGKAGSAVGFVMEVEHCSYYEALKLIAKRYNIEVREKEESAEDIAARQRTESLMIVSEFACRFFMDQLKSGEGRDIGYNYFKSRALEDETIEKFSLGWAPSGKRELVDAALKAGYKLEYLIEAGLAVQREDGSVVDKFRERVMFPIHSVSGRVVAFSGRTLHSDNPAKYVNSPETPIYTKSKNLLGIYFAKAGMARQNDCILVEGNVDMVMMHQLGITNVVASCGTSLTVEQIRLIRRHSPENVTIMYDGDSAGIHAALRGIGLILREGMNVKVVLLPEGEDPDSFARSHSRDQVLEFIGANSEDFISFKARLLSDEAGKDPLKRANLINDIADTIADIPDPVKRTVYVEDCANRFNIDSRLLFTRISRTRKEMQEEQRKERIREARWQENGLPLPPETPVSARVEEYAADSFPIENRILAPAEKELLGFILTHGRDALEFESDSDFYGESVPTVFEFIRGTLDEDGASFANTVYRRAYDAYMQLYDSGMDQDAIIRTMLDSSDRTLADVTAQLSTSRYQLTVKNFEKALTTTSSWLAAFVPRTLMRYGERRLQDRIDKIRASLPSMDTESQMEAMKELVKLQSIKTEIKKQYGKNL